MTVAVLTASHFISFHFIVLTAPPPWRRSPATAGSWWCATRRGSRYGRRTGGRCGPRGAHVTRARHPHGAHVPPMQCPCGANLTAFGGCSRGCCAWAREAARCHASAFTHTHARTTHTPHTHTHTAYIMSTHANSIYNVHMKAPNPGLARPRWRPLTSALTSATCPPAATPPASGLRTRAAAPARRPPYRRRWRRALECCWWTRTPAPPTS